MRKIAAHYIFPVTTKPLKNGIIIINDYGEIIEIIDTKGDLKETSSLEFYNGVIVPGFINTHCHLELSYLKGKIPMHTGHVEFIRQIVENIKTTEVDVDKIENAFLEMKKEGIVAVADISNREITSQIKQNNDIYFHTFIELADFFNNENIETQISVGKKLGKNFIKKSIVAHAPYTCSPEFIVETAKLSRDVYSIHNQEVKSENEMYIKGSGEIFNLLKQRNPFSDFNITKKTALQSYLDKISRNDLNILLVHNIFTTEEDIKYAENLSENIYWTLCPKSNLFIQNKLPEIKNFIKNNCKITLGTDSLATNNRLSIIEEMKNFTEFNFTEVLKWATINGAKALKINNIYGSIEIGKKPGLNLISNFDFKNNHLKKDSFVKKIM
ncbi:MAG: amidohydrolase family protein [Bacteroidales bacterium]|nr:amidohydrolase family protein [Bacteroidales bacterium]